MTRSSVILTGLVGLVGAIILTAICLLVMMWGWVSPLLGRPTYVWGLFLFLLFFSVAEIPVMIFGMRRMLESVNPKAQYVALFTNAGYTFFASVYAAPFILLAGQSALELASGALLGSLCFVRFISSVILLPNAKQS